MKPLLAILVVGSALSFTKRTDFSWDPSPSHDVIYYELRFGPASVTNAGSVFTSVAVTNLTGALDLPAGTNFVHCVAVLDDLQRSDPSNELVVIVTKPRPEAPLNFRRSTANQLQRNAF